MLRTSTWQACVLRQTNRGHSQPSQQQSGSTSSTGTSSCSDIDDDSSEEATSIESGAHKSRQTPPASSNHTRQCHAAASAAGARKVAAAAMPAAARVKKAVACARPSSHCTSPHLVRVQSSFALRSLPIPYSVCTDMLKTATGAGAAVQVEFVVHPADWSVKDYVLSQQPRQQRSVDRTAAAQGGISDSRAAGQPSAAGPTDAQPSAGSTPAAGTAQQQHAPSLASQQATASATNTSSAGQAAAATGSINTVFLGPFGAVLTLRKTGALQLTKLQHQGQLSTYNNGYQVVLHERVSVCTISIVRLESSLLSANGWIGLLCSR